jgi:protein O-mannosyl-transferase
VPRILTSDSYAHLYERMDRPVELSGGRYRPLSLITFALEHELFGNVPLVAHLGNVLLYGLTLPILFLLLVKWLPDRPRWAWVAVILFAVHPIHTEVVANVKSRDEILSLLLLLASLLFLWRAFEIRRRKFSSADLERPRPWVSMTLSGACALLALLSKEYAVSLLLLAPAMLFVFAKTPLRVSVRFAWPIVVAVAAYLWLRISAVGLHRVEAVDLLNDPYLLATPAQTWATKLFVLLQYLRLLIWPHPLSADYSYRHFAYRDFQDPLVWVAVVALIAGIGFAWRGVRRRHWAGFAALFFLVHLLLISNFIVEIGATMGERLVYHASIGFAMLLSGILTWAGSSSVSREDGSRPPLSRLAVGSNALLGAIVAAGVYLTLLRVPDWKNDVTLFTHDVEVVPESARANANAGRGFLLLSDESTETARKEALLERAEVHLKKAIEIDPEIVMAYFTLGAVHDRRGEYEAMERSLNQARQRFPDHPSFATYDPILADRLARWAVDAAQTGDDGQARRLLERSVGLAPDLASLWYYLGLARRADGDLPGAIDAWEQALRLDPTLEQASEALRRSHAPSTLPLLPERGSIER